MGKVSNYQTDYLLELPDFFGYLKLFQEVFTYTIIISLILGLKIYQIDYEESENQGPVTLGSPD